MRIRPLVSRGGVRGHGGWGKLIELAKQDAPMFSFQIRFSLVRPWDLPYGAYDAFISSSLGG
jgi:hypothetical protein